MRIEGEARAGHPMRLRVEGRGGAPHAVRAGSGRGGRTSYRKRSSSATERSSHTASGCCSTGCTSSIERQTLMKAKRPAFSCATSASVKSRPRNRE
eukprot:2424224-Prymnesium_polylepis.1